VAEIEAKIRGAYLDRNELVSQLAMVKTGDLTMTGYVKYADWTGKESTANCEAHYDGGKALFHCDEAK
jgi:hypothetical protein